MTDLENLNRDTFNASLEHITDEEAKNDITFSQESMWGQEIDDKKGRTMEEIQAELEPMNYEELWKKITTVLSQYKDLLNVIKKNERDWQTKNILKNWLNDQITDLKKLKEMYGQFNEKELYILKTRLWQQIFNLENFNNIYDILTWNETADKYKKQNEKKIKRFESLNAKYQQEINDIIYRKDID